MCTQNAQAGIGYSDSAGGVARGNECVGNKWGIYVAETADPELEENDCRDNGSEDILDLRPLGCHRTLGTASTSCQHGRAAEGVRVLSDGQIWLVAAHPGEVGMNTASVANTSEWVYPALAAEQGNDHRVVSNSAGGVAEGMDQHHRVTGPVPFRDGAS